METSSPATSRPVKLTPMLEQYFDIKRQAPDAILLYRLGDFYEMFFEDAERAAPILDLVLTARGKGGESEAPMCGIPYHAAEAYIAKLVRSGFHVALCEQTSDPSESKGIVRREIVRIITPGTAVEGSIIDGESSYLLALDLTSSGAGAAWLDVSTGDFFVVDYSGTADPRLRNDVARIGPKEMVVSRDAGPAAATAAKEMGLALSSVEASYFDRESSGSYLSRHFGTQTLRGFGLEESDSRTGAAAAALRYVSAVRKRELTHVRSIRPDVASDFMLLDAATLDNLEVFNSGDLSRPRASLWSVVQKTGTAMGGRMLRSWLARPLRHHEEIFARHDAVDELTRNRPLLERIGESISTIADLERIVSRISLGTASPRECLTLADSLLRVDDLRELAATLSGPLLSDVRSRLDSRSAVVARIAETIDENPSALVRDGGVIRPGVDQALDALRAIAFDSKSILLRIETAERERTGIGSLKIRFNSVFGYYIEISKANLAKAPPDYIRKQTLVNAERFITPELKDLEEKIVGAEEKSVAIEIGLYEKLLAELAIDAGPILATARAVAELDSLASLATLAIRNRYVRPTLSQQTEISIVEGRHPVIESISGERFIPNDTSIERGINEIQLITGPNMGGKSTYLRQVALIVLLNQIGSFVPAASARLGVFDRIFTRVGASDHLARGESTFMVEMHETANILNNATPASLIILDEVGRGTATFDGLSLAWAIIEFLHDTPARNAITLFATHYHEVTDLAKTKPRVANCSVAVKEWNDQIIFLRKVLPGPADKSYGIQVAKLAGIPSSVIIRARDILATLERKERDVVEETAARTGGATAQLPLFRSGEKAIADEIARADLDALTPIEALNLLHRLKSRLRE